MSIANNLKKCYDLGNCNYAQALSFAESESVDINQDWENETTTFVFADDSALEVCNGEIISFSIVDEN